MDAKELPARPNIEQYRKQAKDLLKARNAGDPAAALHIRTSHPHSGQQARLTLTDAQLVIAREHGFESWPKFVRHIAGVEPEWLASDDVRASPSMPAALGDRILPP